jgi:hypothetical protein
MASILQSQAEMQGRLGAVAEVFGARQAELTQSLGQRLDAMTGRLGQTMTEQTKSTHESLAKLQERLAVIDNAQNNIQSLTGQVVQLQSILSNKQTRGAFGQSRMETIVADGLPQGAYEFQATLSNNSRPDCLVRMPKRLSFAGNRREISAGSVERHPCCGGTGSAEIRRAGVPPRHGRPHQGHFGKIPAQRRNAGHGIHVRAFRIGFSPKSTRISKSSSNAPIVRAS